MKLSKKYLTFEIIKNITIILLFLIFFIKSIINYTINLSKIEVFKVGKYFNSIIIDKNLYSVDKLYQKIIKNNEILNSIETLNIDTLNSYLILSDVDIIQIYNNENISIYNKNFIADKDLKLSKKIQNYINKDLTKSKDIFYVYDETGIYFFKKYIIKSKDNNINKLIMGFNISRHEYINEINEKFGLDATIFWNDKRVDTSIKINNKLQIGSLLDKGIYNEIYGKNLIYNDEVKVLGKPYMAIYIPVCNDENSKISIFIGKAMEEIYSQIYRATLLLVIFTLSITIVISSFLYFRVKNKYINSIIEVDNQMQEFIRDDEKNKLELNDDEISSLKNSFLTMKENIISYEQELKYRLYHDSLTKLKNMSYLLEKYTCSNYKTSNIHCEEDCLVRNTFPVFSVFLINIDNISSINRTLGSRIGDEVLLKVSKIISDFLYPFNLELYKYVGNKFIIILPSKDLFKPENIINLFEEPFEFKENMLSVSISIGVCSIGHNCKNILEILKDANIALNFAKNNSINKIKYFDIKMRNKVNESFEIENDLKKGLLEKQFYLEYQPKVECRTKEILGFEALVRWNHPIKGFIPPDKFIEIAESTGLIIPLGKWILKEAILFIKSINKDRIKNFHIAINISVIQLIQEDFVEIIENILYDHDIDGSSIHFEITESVLIKSYETIANKLIKLRQLGIKIDLDDFGTGYSSLNHLMKLPIDSLKIDKSFIDDIFEKNSFILEIINIGKRIGLTVVAEGVETEKHLELLIQYNCDTIQGYVFSKPLSRENLLSYLTLNGY